MVFRHLEKSEFGLLKDFLYEAIYIPEGVTPPDRSVVELPELALYYEGFGNGPADLSVAAEDDGMIVGAAWTRIMNDYGHVDDETPSLAISVLEKYRGRGVGTQLLKEISAALKNHGYERVSLAVQKDNYAARMYEHAGFRTIRENDEEYIMIREL